MTVSAGAYIIFKGLSVFDFKFVNGVFDPRDDWFIYTCSLSVNKYSLVGICENCQTVLSEDACGGPGQSQAFRPFAYGGSPIEWMKRLWKDCSCGSALSSGMVLAVFLWLILVADETAPNWMMFSPSTDLLAHYTPMLAPVHINSSRVWCSEIYCRSCLSRYSSLEMFHLALGLSMIGHQCQMVDEHTDDDCSKRISMQTAACFWSMGI